MCKIIPNQKEYGLIDKPIIQATPSQRKATIVISLIEESNKKKDGEILEEISKAFANDDIIIPWC